MTECPGIKKISSLRKNMSYFGLTALLAVSAATAQIASGTTGIDASGSTQREKAACNSGMTQQDYVTCMREANNAAADKRSGKLDNAGAQFQGNALKRCDALNGDDRISCQARMLGYGSTSGSVAGGGVVRQVETVVSPPNADTGTSQPKPSSNIMVIPAPQ